MKVYSTQKGWGHWTLNYTDNQSFIEISSYLSKDERENTSFVVASNAGLIVISIILK